MDAISLLKQDHRKVETLFSQFQQGGGSQEFRQLFSQLYLELSLHATVEEQVFYPALAAYKEFSSLLKDSFKDHAEVKAALGELAATDNTTNEWSTKMTKVMKDVQDHVQEEEKELFPKASSVLGEQKLQMLGQELAQAKQINLPGVQSSFPMKELGGTPSPTMPHFESGSSQAIQ